MTIRIQRCFLTLAALAAVSFASEATAKTICVNPNKANCETTIQDAVDIAGPGDMIRISGKFRYFENVVVPSGKEGLVIRGSGGAVVDPDDPNTGSAFFIQSDGVVLRDLRIENGQSYGVELDTDVVDVTVSRSAIIGPNDDCIYGPSGNDGLVVDRSTLASCDNGVEVTGDAVVIRRSTTSNNDSGGFRITGDDAIVDGSAVFLVVDSDAIEIDGDNAEVVKNDVSGCDDAGVDIEGNDALVSRNRFLNVEDGIFVDGDFAVIDNNRLESVGEGIEAVGADPVVTRNRVEGALGDGFFIDCTPCTVGEVSRNRARDAGTDDEGFFITSDASGLSVLNNRSENNGDEPFDIDGVGILVDRNRAENGGGDSNDGCFDISGDDHIVTRNSARRCQGDAFEITGNDHVFERNNGDETSQDGFDVNEPSDGVVLERNSARKNTGNGFELSLNVTNAALLGNRGRDNRADLCDESIASSRSGNKFETTQILTGNPCPIGN
ncbi:MAG: right-handed parallel beta-helix repeat-containing protein [Myxococcota bacterium]|nr:right-handed parallel beta-helix repeat-containing protein [Myxococcota bacterium]